MGGGEERPVGREREGRDTRLVPLGDGALRAGRHVPEPGDRVAFGAARGEGLAVGREGATVYRLAGPAKDGDRAKGGRVEDLDGLVVAPRGERLAVGRISDEPRLAHAHVAIDRGPDPGPRSHRGRAGRIPEPEKPVVTDAGDPPAA